MKRGRPRKNLLTMAEIRGLCSTDNPAGCWVWTKCNNGRGYPCARRHGKCVLVHRAVVELTLGPIHKGMMACHRCDNPSCCNPDHLFVGSQKDNMRDASLKGRMRTGYAKRRSRLPDSVVLQVLRLEGLSFNKIAILFGVDRMTISRIKSGAMYRRVVERNAYASSP